VELPLRFELDLLSAHALGRLAGDTPETIYHAHTPHGLGAAVFANMVGSAHRIVFSRRTSFPVKNLFVNRWKLDRAARIVAVSQAVADGLTSYGFPRERIRVIHSCVDLERFQYHQPCLEEPLRLAVIGSMEKAKGLEMAFDFVRRIRDLPYVLHFVGTGRELPAVREQRASNSRVVCEGFVPDIPSLLNNMFLVLSFSPKEGFPNSLLEAMASGKPVVALANPSTRELISPGETGWLFGTPAEAVEQVKRLSASPDLAIAMGKKASECVACRFSADQMVSKTLQLYQEILA
jgi:glycosyltransferase involved in cell wall biosynthesis